ncbi:di-trans,poly-cis-decaprenylcistransferase [Candidatus Daviesbacteria bacterium]|nr:di-trans,poly-cis-decaprenylcistransferase [Candidatus Daviesbacteria bacterium]
MKLDLNNIPTHIAIIMDGNRRWAKKNNLDTFAGHKQGINKIEEVVEAASKLGVKFVTIWALSSENIKERPKKEVFGLFKLLQESYKNQFKKMIQKGVRIKVIGERSGLPLSIKKIVNSLNSNLVKNPVINLNIAFNYGGKKELINAIKKMLEEGIKPKDISEKQIDKHLYTYPHPSPDLVIRTGGKVRMSNFLMWQTAYSEWYFTDKLWPEFSANDLKKAILWYQNQARNFGK